VKEGGARRKKLGGGLATPVLCGKFVSGTDSTALIS
jgi:hypothetical protein